MYLLFLFVLLCDIYGVIDNILAINEHLLFNIILLSLDLPIAGSFILN